MDADIDRGEIIWQRAFKLNDDSQYSIAYKTKKEMAYGLVEVLNNYSSGSISALSSDYDTSYHRAPDKILGRKFHDMGLKIIRISDLRLILAYNFD